MTRVVLTMLLLAACKDPEPVRPELTPLMANQLRALAPQCEIKTQREGAIREVRSCQGPQASVSVRLDGKRRIHTIEVTIRAGFGGHEARNLFDHAMRGALSDEVLLGIGERLLRAGEQPEAATVGGVRTSVSATKAARSTEYKISLGW